MYGIRVRNYSLVSGALIRRGSYRTFNHLMIMLYHQDATEGFNIADVGNDSLSANDSRLPNLLVSSAQTLPQICLFRRYSDKSVQFAS